MRKICYLIVCISAFCGMLNAQTMNVKVGQVTYQFPADQAGEMTYNEGTTLTIMNKVFTLSDIASIYVDDAEVIDNTVQVVYSSASATITVAGNIAQYLTISVSGAHVNIEQHEDLEQEITYTLSGASSDGEFYMSGSYKATVELKGLTLTNTNPITSGAAIHIQNGKRIKMKVITGTTNTLVDAVDGSQKGALYVKGHPEFVQHGTLNVTGNVKHAIKAGEYVSLKNATINVVSAAGDGINCAQYFLMESGTITISGIEDDGIQCDIDDTDAGSTGQTADHEDEDSGNIYIEGGTISINTAGIAAKGIKAEGDIIITDGMMDVTTTGNGKWDEDDLKTKAAACLGSDANVNISGGTLTLTSMGAGGKGINCDAALIVSGGEIRVVTQGGLYYNNGTTENTNYTGNTDNIDSDYHSSSKGIKADGAITISGGVISVSTAGINAEGIESKNSILITEGQVTVNAYDDAINVGGDEAGDLIISGGYVYARATNNDGIDGNSNVYIKGGLVYAVGGNTPEVAIDANSEEQKKLYIQGGTLIAVGGLESGAQISGGTCKQTTSFTADSWYALYNGSELVAAFKTPTASNSSSGGGSGGRPGGGGPGGGSKKLVVYTSSTPALKSGVTVSGGTEYFDGAANIGGTVSGGSSVTLSNYSSGGR